MTPRPSTFARKGRPRGFTLIELLVVLAILVTLTSVAVRSLGGVKDGASFTQSQRTLEEVRRAILGSTEDGVFVPGFLSDVGRLPTTLSELWQAPVGLMSSHLATDPADPEVTLATGWRGPYVQLAPGALSLGDGFGSPLDIDSAAGHWKLASRGADGAPGGTGEYDVDLLVPIIDSAMSVDLITSEVQGSVQVLSDPGVGTWTVTVFVYVPNPLTGEISAVQEDSIDETPSLSAFPVVFHYSFTAAQSNALTSGLRIVRAYLHAPVGPGVDPRPLAIWKSVARTRALRPGATILDLEIP